MRPAVLLSAAALANGAGAPNIVFVLTDDQDQMLGASFPPTSDATPMPQAKRLLADEGATATNMFAHTPICCPSRAEIVSGRYFHNIRTQDEARPHTDKTCMHVNESKVHNFTFATQLQAAGYQVGLFGKYLNGVPNDDWTVPPPGFDAWLANGGGDYTAPEFGARGLAPFAGVHDGMVHFPAANYTTGARTLAGRRRNPTLTLTATQP